MQQAWGYEPDASTYPIKVLIIDILNHYQQYHYKLTYGKKLSSVDFTAPALLVKYVVRNISK